MKITIGGSIGSGKSVVSKKLAEKFGLKRYGIGDFRRKMATDRGITIEELNKIGEKEDWTDREADAYLKKIGEEEDNFVIEGKLAWYFVPESIKIFLKVDSEAAAKRVFDAKRDSEKAYANTGEVKLANKRRITSDQDRYKRIYGVDCYDSSQCDIVIDTTKLNEKEVGEAVEKAVARVGGKSI